MSSQQSDKKLAPYRHMNRCVWCEKPVDGVIHDECKIAREKAWAETEIETQNLEDYRHRHIDIKILPSSSSSTTTTTTNNNNHKERRFYVPSSFELTLDRLEQILQREGSNLSKWIRQNAQSYVRLHEPGNPQQRIDTILDLGQPYRANSCIDCPRPGVYEVTERGKKTAFLLCEEDLRRRRPRLTSWRRLDEVT